MKITLNVFDSSAFLMQVKRGSISQNETMYTDIFIKEKKPQLFTWVTERYSIQKNKLIKKTNPNSDSDVMRVARDLFRCNESLTSYLSFC